MHDPLRVCFRPMRITRIKLAGFKSFVDPTTLTLPGNLTGIVGPNGCGKSNIIDALLWVMGESSAKHLRGESMSDVIFNGSNTRKPVGQATVEIIFDNADGTIGGQYAGFGEISIKRSVSRDGVSNYYLNNTRCRRKDITQIFLGTGIGARGYSVIAQGTISRVIEARPEELRSFLEEAAGISKYKERRHETENRMQHTRENIERLDDIREELDKQLNHLNRQAKAAERYQELRAEERVEQGRMLAIRWNELERARSEVQQLTEQRTNTLEREIASLRELEARQVAGRGMHAEATERLNAIQGTYYSCSAEISRLEESIKNNEQRERDLRTDRDDAAATLGDVGLAIEAEETQQRAAQESVSELVPRLSELQNNRDALATELQSAEALLGEWQAEWDTHQRQHSELSQQEQSGRVRLEHLLNTVQDYERRHSKLDEERVENALGKLAEDIAQARHRVEELEASRAQRANQRSALRAEIEQSRHAVRQAAEHLHSVQSNLEEQRGRYSSLRALQDAAYGDEGDHAAQWLSDNGMDNLSRLAELVEIESGWERALEAALRLPLGAWCAAGLTERVLEIPGALSNGQLAVMNTDLSVSSREGRASGLLLDKVQSELALDGLLSGVFWAEDEIAARRKVVDLKPHECVVLSDGSVFGAGWFQLAGRQDREESVLARERRLQQLTLEVQRLEHDATEAQEAATRAQAHQRGLEEQESHLNEQQEAAGARHNEERDQLAALEAESKRRAARLSDIETEQLRIRERSAEAEQQIARTREEQAINVSAMMAQNAQRDALSQQRATRQQQVDAAREQWQDMQRLAHTHELELQLKQSELRALTEALERNRNAAAQLQRRRDEFSVALEALSQPRVQMRTELDEALANQLSASQEMASARQALGALDDAARKAESERAEIEQRVSDAQAALEQARLETRTIEVRQQELKTRFEQIEADLDQVKATLESGDTEEAVQERLSRIEARIQRLGAINLAAIDEFKQLSERKEYLDRQHADLSEALATLEDAIRKIDRETRTRFRETFDKVNNGLQAMFPVLFGGGHAYLELTSDDLLETGVSVMARPPGKRNSTIHLLSGGEKALTALAFVFSIFELNPAPFCLLDEVDAPLDDANVLRLTEMLRAMAERVQFLFVSHNKITMEIAGQLVGVTMQEPGVSRLVSVNVDQAVELAATAA